MVAGVVLVEVPPDAPGLSPDVEHDILKLAMRAGITVQKGAVLIYREHRYGATISACESDLLAGDNAPRLFRRSDRDKHLRVRISLRLRRKSEDEKRGKQAAQGFIDDVGVHFRWFVAVGAGNPKGLGSHWSRADAHL